MGSFDESWEKIHATRRWGQYPSEFVIRFIARNYYSESDRRKKKILDFGCGAGAHTWFLAKEGFDTYAFDGSPSAVKNTEEKLKQEGCFAHLDCFDALETQYEEEYFDAIVDNFTIQANMLCSIKEMYKACYNLLKKDGKLFTAVFSNETTGYGTGRELEPGTYVELENGTTQHSCKKHFFKENELFELLDLQGFKNINIDKVYYTDQGNVVSQYIATATK